jgi:hypothetical protein
MGNSDTSKDYMPDTTWTTFCRCRVTDDWVFSSLDITQLINAQMSNGFFVESEFSLDFFVFHDNPPVILFLFILSFTVSKMFKKTHLFFPLQRGV